MDLMRIRIKDPKRYDGTCDDTLLGNFLEMSLYTLKKMNGYLNEVKVNAIVMFLKGTVKL